MNNCGNCIKFNTDSCPDLDHSRPDYMCDAWDSLPAPLPMENVFALPESVYIACEEFKRHHGATNIITRQLFGNVRTLATNIAMMVGAVRKARGKNPEDLRGRTSDYVDAVIEHWHRILHTVFNDCIQIHRADLLAVKTNATAPAENPGDDEIIQLMRSGFLIVNHDGGGIPADIKLSRKLLSTFDLPDNLAMDEVTRDRVFQRSIALSLLDKHIPMYLAKLGNYREPVSAPWSEDTREIPEPLVHRAHF